MMVENHGLTVEGGDVKFGKGKNSFFSAPGYDLPLRRATRVVGGKRGSWTRAQVIRGIAAPAEPLRQVQYRFPPCRQRLRALGRLVPGRRAAQ